MDQKLSVKIVEKLFDSLSLDDQKQFRILFEKRFHNMPTVLNLATDAKTICKFIYENFDILHFVYNGKIYEEYENTWENTLHEDAEFSCVGYLQHDIVCNKQSEFKIVEVEDQSKIEYVMKYRGFSDSDEVPNVQEYMNNMANMLDHLTIIYEENRKQAEHIEIINTSGENQDHRGSTHTILDVQMENNLFLKLPCTIHQLAEKLFRIKSHKWDKWYELFSEVTAIFFDDSYATLEVDFDHGS